MILISRLLRTQEQIMIHYYPCTHLYIKTLKEVKTHERKCASSQQFQETALMVLTFSDLILRLFKLSLWLIC